MDTLHEDETGVVAEFLTLFDIIELARARIMIFSWDQLCGYIRSIPQYKQLRRDAIDDWFDTCLLCPGQYTRSGIIPRNVARDHWMLNTARVPKLQQYNHINDIVLACLNVYGSFHNLSERVNDICKMAEYKRDHQDLIVSCLHPYSISYDEFVNSPYNNLNDTCARYCTYTKDICASKQAIKQTAKRIFLMNKIHAHNRHIRPQSVYNTASFKRYMNAYGLWETVADIKKWVHMVCNEVCLNT